MSAPAQPCEADLDFAREIVRSFHDDNAMIEGGVAPCYGHDIGKSWVNRTLTNAALDALRHWRKARLVGPTLEETRLTPPTQRR